MTIANLVKKFEKINRELYKKAKEPLRCHGLDHHRRVCQNALLLTKSLKQKVDLEVLIPACYLHDISAYGAGEAKNHHEQSAQMAKKILLKEKIASDKIGMITKAIEGHGFENKKHAKKEPIETTLLRDADKMDALGPVGIARMIMARAKRGDDLEEIVKKFRGADIKRRWQAIKTPRAKELTKNNYKISLDFFEVLNRLLK